MKNFFPLIVLVLLLGAGCAQNPVTPSSRVESTSTSGEVVSRVPDFWNDVNVSVGEVTVRFSFPGSFTTVDMIGSGQVLNADLGTAVENPGERSVPGRSLRMFVIDGTDERIKNCAFSELGWDAGQSPSIQKDLTFGTDSGLTFCGSRQNEGAAGNRYATYAYSAPVSGRVLVFEFTVHSVVCENFERPEEECVAFDEARDTVIFAEILSKISME